MAWYKRNRTFIVFIVHLATFSFVFGENYISRLELNLKSNQKVALARFMDRVLPILPHEYMKDEIYLIKWLQAKNFNVNKAEEFLQNNLKWRELNKVDSILEENFSKVLLEYPVYVDTYDIDSSPIITASIADWNVLKALKQKSNQWHRLPIKTLEESTVKVRQAYAQGKNVTHFHFVVNLEGFNLRKHFCPQCVAAIQKMIRTYENYYPGQIGKIVLLNASPRVVVARAVIRGTMSGRSRGHLSLFGTNKKEWQKFLLSFIDPSQLTPEFGGTRIRAPVSVTNNFTVY